MVKPHKICRNEVGETNCIYIAMDEDEAKDFLSRMWESCGPIGKPSEPLVELTDRGRCIRTTYTWLPVYGDCVCVRTHGFWPHQDKHELDKSYLQFLIKEGYDVTPTAIV